MATRSDTQSSAPWPSIDRSDSLRVCINVRGSSVRRWGRASGRSGASRPPRRWRDRAGAGDRVDAFDVEVGIGRSRASRLAESSPKRCAAVASSSSAISASIASAAGSSAVESAADTASSTAWLAATKAAANQIASALVFGRLAFAGATATTISAAQSGQRFVERVGIDDSARPIDHGLAALGEHGFRGEHGGDRTGDLAHWVGSG